MNRDGKDDPHIGAPPIDNRGIVVTPQKKDEEDKIYLSVEIESEYPGGLWAWKRFLLKTFRYPEDALQRMIDGTVHVLFIVDTAGLISEVKAISGPAELQEEAVRVISKSGRWTPAIQNGRKVKSYKRQPIIFRLDE